MMARLRDWDWRDEAVCADVDPDVFFPTSSSDVDATEAKAICRQCPVRVDCLEFALANREKFGIWGGATEWERRQIARRRLRS